MDMSFIITETPKTTPPAFQTEADAPSGLLEKTDAQSSLILFSFVKSFLDMHMVLIIKHT